MQLKHTIVMLTAAELLSAQTYAHEALLEAPHAALAAAFNQADMAALVDYTNQPMQLAALSGQEMRETEGAVAPMVGLGIWLAGGAVVGGV